MMLSAMIEPIRYALGATIAIKRTHSSRRRIPRGQGYARRRLLSGQLRQHAGYESALRFARHADCEERSFAEFWHHQLRWARTYRTVRPVSIATILMHGPFWALMLLCLARQRRGFRDVGAGGRRAARDVGCNRRPRAQDAGDAERSLDGPASRT